MTITFALLKVPQDNRDSITVRIVSIVNDKQTNKQSNTLDGKKDEGIWVIYWLTTEKHIGN